MRWQEYFDLNTKPKAKLIGANGNIYNLLAICKLSLHNYDGTFEELFVEVKKSGSYEKALVLIEQYIDVI